MVVYILNFLHTVQILFFIRLIRITLSRRPVFLLFRIFNQIMMATSYYAFEITILYVLHYLVLSLKLVSNTLRNDQITRYQTPV